MKTFDGACNMNITSKETTFVIQKSDVWKGH